MSSRFPRLLLGKGAVTERWLRNCINWPTEGRNPDFTFVLITNVKECDSLRSNNLYNSSASFRRHLPFPKEGFFTVIWFITICHYDTISITKSISRAASIRTWERLEQTGFDAIPDIAEILPFSAGSDYSCHPKQPRTNETCRNDRTSIGRFFAVIFISDKMLEQEIR